MPPSAPITSDETRGMAEHVVEKGKLSYFVSRAAYACLYVMWRGVARLVAPGKSSHSVVV